MEDKYLCLNGIKKGDTLSETQIKALSDLKRYSHLVAEGNGTEYDFDLWYLYAGLAEMGLIEEDEEFIQDLYYYILYISLMYMNARAHDIYEKYPLAFSQARSLFGKICSWMSVDLHDFYLYELKDEKTAFEVVIIATYVSNDGYDEEFELKKDECRLMAAKCYMDGIGVEKNYVAAFDTLSSYRTNPLAICYESRDVFPQRCYSIGNELIFADDVILKESTLSRLFMLLKEDADNGKNYPYLHYCLAVMYREGLGTQYNYEKYKEHLKLGMQNTEASEKDCYSSESLMMYDTKRINRDHNGIPYNNIKLIDSADIAVNDIVVFGKYNHRDILWRVIRTEEDKALLLSLDCLESTYIANNIYYAEDFQDEDEEEHEEGVCMDDNPEKDFSNYEFSPVKRFVDNLYNYIFPWNDIDDTSVDFKNVIVTNERDEDFFLLGKNDIIQYVSNDDMYAGARLRYTDPYDDYIGINVDSKDQTAPWLTSTAGEQDETVVFVDSYGKFQECTLDADGIGIRPAVWIKINNR